MPDSDHLEALILGIVQGVAEFLPISSSGHLVIFAELLHQFTGRSVDPAADLQMNVALHFGTLLSILAVYRRDLLRLLRQPRQWLLILLASVPVALAGLALKDLIEQELQRPLSAGLFLLVTAVLLWTAQEAEARLFGKSRASQTPLGEISWRQALAVGLFQAVAILPGISRSGSTIAGGLIVGLRREAATTFSFFIAIPAILGAVVLMLAEVVTGTVEAPDFSALLLGAAVSFVVGWVSLRWLIQLISQRKLHWFAWYCAAAGIVTIVWQVAAM